jgi:hypothetical protein
MPLLGELDRERERLGLPSFGKHRLALLSRQVRQRLEALGFQYRGPTIIGTKTYAKPESHFRALSSQARGPRQAHHISRPFGGARG